ncbi:MAG: TM2 domain-containing protein [Kurthia sp.]|nr:TM2 domain-containing protein [Candidatus Kurthia equi]
MEGPLSDEKGDILNHKPIVLSKREFYDKYKKRTVRAYFSWLFLGLLGLHRFYIDWSWSGLAMLLVGMIGLLLYSTVLGKVMLIALVLFWLVDAIRLPTILRVENEKMQKSL